MENSAPSQQWWCDGVFALSIVQLDSTCFRIIGAAYWADERDRSSHFYLAPFEIEFYFPAAGADLPVRSTVRFGGADQFGNIVKSPPDSYAYRMIENRPRRNADWAFAVELTSLPGNKESIEQSDEPEA